MQVCRSSYHLRYNRTHSRIDLYRIIRHAIKRHMHSMHGHLTTSSSDDEPLAAEELAEERRARGVKLLPRKRKAIVGKRPIIATVETFIECRVRLGSNL